MLHHSFAKQISAGLCLCFLFLFLLPAETLAQLDHWGKASNHKPHLQTVEATEDQLISHHSTDGLVSDKQIVFNTGPYCPGETIRLVGPNLLGLDYEWTGPDGFHSNKRNPEIANAKAVNAGVYALTIKNKTGKVLLSDRSTRVIIAHQPSAIQISNDGPKCEGESLQLFSSISAQKSLVRYQWTGPEGFHSDQQNPVIDQLSQAAAGRYELKVFVNGCFVKTLSTEVKVNEVPAPPIISYTNDRAHEDLMLSTDYFEEAQFEWLGPNGFTAHHAYPLLPKITAQNGGRYECYVTVNGCTSDAGHQELIVDTSDQSSSFSCNIPNAISPNHDGKNDVFAIPCLDPSKANSLIIYNQKGQEIYQSENYQNDWDGTFGGNPLPTGTYFYALQIKDEQRTSMKGYLYIKS